MKVQYDLLNHLGNYRNITQFQISQEKREGKTEKGIDTKIIKTRVFRKVFSKQVCFIRYRQQDLQANRQRKYSRFTFVENTIRNSPKVPRARFFGSDKTLVLLANASLAVATTLLQQLLACLNFTLNSEDLFCWYK